MRLDRYLAETGAATRSEATKLIRSSKVTVDGAVVRDPARHIDPAAAVIALRGERLVWREFTYVMLNKPAGYVSSTEDRGTTVMELLEPSFVRRGFFPCGRLDIDTVGLLLVTDDGALAHELLSPKHHVEKTYRFRCDPPIGEAQRQALEAGVDIGGLITRPAAVMLESGDTGEITVHEGKFHQIKRMFEAVGSKITYLERVRFGGIALDASLERGEWRYLTAEEEEILRRSAGRN